MLALVTANGFANLNTSAGLATRLREACFLKTDDNRVADVYEAMKLLFCLAADFFSTQMENALDPAFDPLDERSLVTRKPLFLGYREETGGNLEPVVILSVPIFVPESTLLQQPQCAGIASVDLRVRCRCRSKAESMHLRIGYPGWKDG